MVKIKYNIDRFGHLTMTPVSERFNARIKAYLEEWKVFWSDCVLIQEDYNIEAELEDFTPSERKDLREGWTVTKLEDPYDFLHRVGWDAHEGVKL